MKAERTRQYILERAAPLFNKKGFEGTSLTDLERATGLTKGALYGNFGDKDTLASEAFVFAADKLRMRIQALLKESPTYKGKLFALLDFYATHVLDPPVPGGCPLLNTAVEADDHRVAMRPVVTAEIQQVVQAIAVLLRKGVRAGEFRKDINVRELSYTFFCALEGAIMFSRVEGTSEAMNIIVRHLRNRLEEITCNKNG